MSVVWMVFICIILICVQVVTLWSLCRQHRQEMNVQVGVMAILTAAHQPSEIRAHCRRVANIAERIALEMRLPAKRLALVRAIGILHEIDGIDGITSNAPMEFAILAVADSFDRVVYNNVESLSLDEAVEEIRGQVETRFDPAVVKALMTVVLRSNWQRCS